MPIPINQKGASDLANKLLSSLKSAYSACLKAQAGNDNNTYGMLVNIPSYNKALQDSIAAVQGSGDVARVIGELNNLLPSDTTSESVSAFAAALDSLSLEVESNASLFLMSINPTTKRPEFTTPVSEAVKTTISNRISGVLSEVS